MSGITLNRARIAAEERNGGIVMEWAYGGCEYRISYVNGIPRFEYKDSRYGWSMLQTSENEKILVRACVLMAPSRIAWLEHSAKKEAKNKRLRSMAAQGVPACPHCGLALEAK